MENDKVEQNLLKELKFLEEERVKTFKNWQYAANENCSVKKMAEAGFFYTGQHEDDDSATCFVCGKVLDGWENTDKPWNEHEKHAPNCEFVKIHLSEDQFTVEELLNLASKIVKSYVTRSFNIALVGFNKRTEKIRDMRK